MRITKCISFNDDEQDLLQSASQHKNFSGYVKSLIRKDIDGEALKDIVEAAVKKAIDGMKITKEEEPVIKQILIDECKLDKMFDI